MHRIVKVRQDTRHFAETTTIHGIQEFVQFGGCLGKAVWLAITMSVLIFVSSEMYDLIVEFRRNPQIVTTSSTDFVLDPEINVFCENTADTLFNQSFLNENGVAIRSRTHLQHVLYLFDDFLYGAYENGMMGACLAATHLKACYEGHEAACESFQYNDIAPTGQNYVEEFIGTIQHLFIETGSDIEKLYDSSLALVDHLSNPLNVMGNAWTNNLGSEQTLKKDFLLSPIGYGYRFNTSNVKLTEASSITIRIEQCNPNASWNIGIGRIYLNPQYRPTISVSCGWLVYVFVKIEVKTYNKGYCNEDYDVPCKTKCLIEQASRTNLCLPYMGLPKMRPKVKYCGFESLSCNQKLEEACLAECSQCTTCRPCRSVNVVSIQPTFQVHGLQHQDGSHGTEVQVYLMRGTDVVHVHIEPKYSPSVMLSSIGGVMGIGFGISIMSIIQVVTLCGKLAKGLLPTSLVGSDSNV